MIPRGHSRSDRVPPWIFGSSAGVLQLRSHQLCVAMGGGGVKTLQSLFQVRTAADPQIHLLSGPKTQVKLALGLS